MNNSDDYPHEGGHMSSRFGRIVRTTDADLPYKAVLTHDQVAETECWFGTMREAEAFIRRNTPRPKARSTFWDRDAPEG
jgi:hypothetical protein